MQAWPKLQLMGPEYRYQGERLEQPHLIYVLDHHYDEHDYCMPVKQLLGNSLCDPSEHVLVFDHVSAEDEFPDNITVCLPLLAAAESHEFMQQNITPNWDHKHRISNVMINKRRMNRNVLLLLLDHFGIHDFEYTLCWEDIDLPRREMMAQIADPVIRHMVETCRVPVPARSFTIDGNVQEYHGIRLGENKNCLIYQQVLQTNIFEPTYVSLITEPTMFEREAMITEKTIMAIWGGNIPIWVGGWAQASYLQSLGFDMFTDIVDHGYQFHQDPWRRCYEAVERNQSLLKDPNIARDFFTSNRSRFQHNLDLLKLGAFHRDCWRQADTAPEQVRTQIWTIVNGFRHGYVRREDVYVA